MPNEIEVQHLPRWKKFVVSSDGKEQALSSSNAKMQNFTLRIPMKPVPYKLKWGKHGVYNVRAAEKRIAQQWIKAQYVGPPIEEPLHIHYIFFMPADPKWGKAKRMLFEMEDIKHLKVPDVDNLMKFYNDCLKGLVMKDDRHITCSGEKLYSPIPSILAIVTKDNTHV